MNLYPFVFEAILQTEISFAEYHAEITDAEKKNLSLPKIFAVLQGWNLEEINSVSWFDGFDVPMGNYNSAKLFEYFSFQLRTITSKNDSLLYIDDGSMI